ncbi:BTB/POZ domain protein [Dictyocaulus viviparus]|uniref:BTB/POZ domain protein n=1 Tax=Dictyocaulus viviparus TaxID=29172 RepID=A0A0D8X8G0_DICVI|nr:BTB/POZ domain protein [Dictyocaulus viviparus]
MEVNSDVTNDVKFPTVTSTLMRVPMYHKSELHSRLLLNQLAELRDNSRLCDVALVVKVGTRINAHRLVLTACSNYFKAMFTNEMAESRLQEIEMYDMDADTLDALIGFCYSGEIKVNDQNVQSLLPAACLLQLNEVQNVCCEFLKKQLDPSNCLGIRAFADTHSCRELLRSADKYTLHNFQDVVGTEEFLLLPVNHLIELISSEELHVRSEENVVFYSYSTVVSNILDLKRNRLNEFMPTFSIQVFAAVIQWVRFDLSSRKQYLSKLMEHVRLPLCHPKFLVSIVSEDALIKADATCRDLVDEAKVVLIGQSYEKDIKNSFKNYLLLPLERPNMQGPRTRPRKPIKFGEVLYAVGGWCSGDAIASVERLDPSRSMPVWQCVTPMGKRRCGVGVAVVDNLLYAVGGHDGQTYLNSIERFDPATNQWSCDVAPTSTCRTSVGVAVLDGFLYAVGGQDGINCLDIVERSTYYYCKTYYCGIYEDICSYDARRNEWTCVAPMGTRRLGVSVSVLNGCLYAVGGSDGQSPLNTVERLDPRVGRWEVVRPMTTRRKHLGSAIFDGHLYAVGGRDDSCELSSAEKYNPTSNEWMTVVAMNNRRSGVGLAVVNEKLYAVGGFDGTTYLKTTEVFDPESNQWKHHGCMNYRRLGGGVGVIRMLNQYHQQQVADAESSICSTRPCYPSDLC